jgi:hypothetical protein
VGDKWVVGARVEANFKNRGKICLGTLTRIRLNGTVDVDYDTGDSEHEVRRELVTLLERYLLLRSTLLTTVISVTAGGRLATTGR